MFWGGAEERVRPGVEKASVLDSEPHRLPILAVLGGGEGEKERRGKMRVGGKVAWWEAGKSRVPGFGVLVWGFESWEWNEAIE